MNTETINEEIKKYQNLPRAERRKVERQLQKKYNNKNIRIKCGKTKEEIY